MPGGLRPPLEVIASWKFNHVNPEHAGRYVVITTAVMLALTYIIVVMRLWARFRLARSAGIDDALIVVGMVPLTGMAVSVCLAFTKFGMDKHVWDSQAYELVNARKITIAGELFYMVTTCITKVSILLFYRRLAAGTITPMFQWILYAAIAFVVAYFVAFFTNIFLICKPFNSFWLQADYIWLTTNREEFRCQDEAVVLVSSAAISAFQDVLACGMPMILLWKLQIPRRQKYALGAIFFIGIFLCVCAILRSIAIYRTYYTTYDMTWQSQAAWFWLSIEAHFAVICASAPALKTFFKQALKDYTYGFRRSGKSSNFDLSVELGQSGCISHTDSLGAVYGGQRGGLSAAPEVGSGGTQARYDTKRKKVRLWDGRVDDSEHELVHTKGGIDEG